MKYTTVGRKYCEGKVVLVKCLPNDSLKNIEIKDQCFLLIYLSGGLLSFRVGEKTVEATAPCFICFDERENPKLISKTKASYFSVYFHPRFFRYNLTFEKLRFGDYSDLAAAHDIFLLRPFLDGQYVIPVCDNMQGTVEDACINMEKELRVQRDWYWSCRGRSYFIEILIALERMYGMIGYGAEENSHSVPAVNNEKLHDAILFIEGHYMKALTLSDISDAAGMNYNTLTSLFKKELGVTAMEYLMDVRVKVAKKQLSFTNIPIKDIAYRCGFKTVQHFGRVFKAHTGITPDSFRKQELYKK